MFQLNRVQNTKCLWIVCLYSYYTKACSKMYVRNALIPHACIRNAPSVLWLSEHSHGCVSRGEYCLWIWLRMCLSGTFVLCEQGTECKYHRTRNPQICWLNACEHTLGCMFLKRLLYAIFLMHGWEKGETWGQCYTVRAELFSLCRGSWTLYSLEWSRIVLVSNTSLSANIKQKANCDCGHGIIPRVLVNIWLAWQNDEVCLPVRSDFPCRKEYITSSHCFQLRNSHIALRDSSLCSSLHTATLFHLFYLLVFISFFTTGTF